MSATSPKPVLIVGAGPTGMVLASELARRRIPVRLIDRKPAPTETSRSFTLHARTMEMFEHMGLAHRFLEDGLQSRGFYFTFKGKQEHPTLDFSGLATRYPYVLVYNQNETEQRLREHLDATYDVRPQWGTALTELSFVGAAFTAKLAVAEDNGREEIVHPEWIVGCDGVHSFVRKAMDLEFEGEDYEDMVMQMMDVRCRDFPGADEWVHYYMSKDNFLLVTKLPDGNHRVLISDTGEADDAELSPRRAFQRLIDGHLDATTLDEPQWATKWTIWKRLATDYRSGNALLAGDAAHVHSPSGGQGMNIGMQDAFNLGWKLAMVISGRAKPALLDTYAPERQPIGAQAIAGTDAMHDIIMAHGHGMEDRLELTRRSGWHDEAVERISGLSYTYRAADGALRAGEPIGGLAPGDRAPDARLSKRLRLFDLLRHPCLTLLLVPPPAGDDGRQCERIVGEVDRRFASALKCFVIGGEPAAGIDAAQCIADETGEFAAAYGAPGSGWIYLVRPDGYVAFGGPLAAPNTLLEYLGQWFEEAGS